MLDGRYSVLLVRLILSLILALSFTGMAYAQGHVGLMVNNSMFVPLRGVFQELGCEVGWAGDTQTVTMKNGEKVIVLGVGKTEAQVAGSALNLQQPPRLVNGSVYVPLRFCTEALGAEVSWNQATREATIVANGQSIKVRAASDGEALKQYNLKVGSVNARVVEIPQGAARAKMVLGNNFIGGTEELASLALRSGAVAAINGTFFEAYHGRPDPWNAIINNGKVLHVQHSGTAIGFTDSGQVKMDPVNMEMECGLNGNYNTWFCFGINHTPQGGDEIWVYTPERGATIGFNYGISVVVDNGKVTRITRDEDVAIPANGFVINCTGAHERVASIFKVGDEVDYRIRFDNTQSDWSDVVTAVGAGPRLVTNGQISVNPQAEGFTEAKITQGGGARSAIGVKADGTMLLVTVPAATVYQLADAMYKLGAYNAMNLDGGASSGLWFKGKYVNRPGRLLSNALVFY